MSHRHLSPDVVRLLYQVFDPNFDSVAVLDLMRAVKSPSPSCIEGASLNFELTPTTAHDLLQTLAGLYINDQLAYPTSLALLTSMRQFDKMV